MTKRYSPSTKGFYADDIHTEDQIPSDAVEVADDLYAALFAAQSQGKVITMGAAGLPIAVDPSVLLTPAQVAGRLSLAVQSHIDSAARALGYDSVLAAISYADEPSVPKFQAEGTALRAWRSAVWAAAGPTIAAVEGGAAALAADALIATLPTFVPPTV